MKNKLPWLFLDIDGTILDKNGKIHPDVQKNIEKYTRNGGKVTLISGRLPRGMFEVIERLKLTEQLHIGSNGSVVYEKENFENKKILDKLGYKTKNILNSLKNTDVPAFLCMVDSIEYEFNKKDVKEKHLMHFQNVQEPKPKHSQNIKYNDVLKILLFIEEKNKRLEKKAREKLSVYGDEISVVRCSENAIEIMPKGLNKGSSIKKLVKRNGWTINNTVACGDNENDLEMLQVVNQAYIVENAKDVLKKHNFKQVRSCEQGGVSDIIIKLLKEGDINE